MDTKLERLATAALLHDIGKFWSRTGTPKPFTDQEAAHFNDTWKHALWTGRFVEQYLEDGEVASWARKHHSPDSRESYIISLADWLSSGERRADDTQQTGAPESAPLANILSRLRISGEMPENAKGSVLPLTQHGDFDNAPLALSGEATLSKADYEALWKTFAAQAECAGKRPLRHNTWLALMRRFCSRIPAATPTRVGAWVPDISLYDHSRTTAAIASCLFADDIPEAALSELRTALSNRKADHPAMSEPVCRLVCGNLSGIQQFLYTIVSKHAAKTLRGRSLALQLVAEACALHVCERAGVPECCILYNGGGRFYALVPVNADIQAIADHISDHIHEAFGGQLSIHVGHVPVTPANFQSGRFSQLWTAAGRAATAEKARKYTRLAKNDYKGVFGFHDHGGETSKCSVCGKESKLHQIETDIALCEDCQEYEDLGTRLRYAKWLVRSAPTSRSSALHRFFNALGCDFTITAKPEEVQRLDPVEITQLNGFDIKDLETLRPPSRCALNYRLIARAWPRGEAGAVLTFEEMAERARGVRKLGVFRADVDNLGALFGLGLGEGATMSRVAAVSTLLTDFFEGYLNCVIETDYADTLGVIYAGGDDLFVVGAWDAAFDFATRLRADFDTYTGTNPDLTFSGGIVVVNDHLPIRYAAQMAQNAEEAAKSYARAGREKNALTLFNTPIGFEELPAFTSFKELLLDTLEPAEGTRVPKSFLRRLYDIWEAYLRERRIIDRRVRGRDPTLETAKAEARWQRWRWMLVYGIREFAKKHRDRATDIEEIQRRLLEPYEGTLSIEDRLGVPLRWVELITREER